MNTYKHLFFDLDRTLWDFDANARETFVDLYEKYSMQKYIDGHDLFFERYNFHNERLWEMYRNGKINKTFLRKERFYLTLKEFDIIDRKLSESLEADYLLICPQKTNLLPGTIETMEYLYKKYPMYILTNGFKETQMIKLECSKLAGYFRKMITSDEVGINKPKKAFFTFALTATNARKRESVMIGDDLAIDILGAKNSGIDQIYFNPLQIPHKEVITQEISKLNELCTIL